MAEQSGWADTLATLIGTLVVIALIAGVVGIVHLATNHAHAKYRAYSPSAGVVAPNEIAIEVHVRNVGKVAGTPYCTVYANVATTWNAALAPRRLEPGQSEVYSLATPVAMGQAGTIAAEGFSASCGAPPP